MTSKNIEINIGAKETASVVMKDVADAFKNLGIVSDKELQAIAASSKAAFDSLKASGTASARELAEGFKKAAADAIRASNGIVPAWVQAEAAAQKLQISASGAFSEMYQKGRKAQEAMVSISSQLKTLQSLVASVAGIQFGTGMIKDAIATADSFNNLQARIKLATGEGEAFKTSFKEVSDIALRTGSNLEQTGILFTRVAEAGKSAGLSTQAAIAQSLSLTETINQAMQLSGGSAESSKAAITQLIQGLQSGVLRGEEFNSVMEQAPRLAKALADGLGVTTGELRKMAEAGTLSADTVIKSLKGQSDVLKAEFATLPDTVGRAVEKLKTQWMLYIGDLDKTEGITKKVASGLNALANNLDTVVSVAVRGGEAWGLYKIAMVSADLVARSTAKSAALQAAASAEAAVATAAHGAAASKAGAQVAAYGAAATAAGTQVATASVAGSAAAVGGWRAATAGVGAFIGRLGMVGAAAIAAFEVGKLALNAGDNLLKKMSGLSKAEADLAAADKRYEEQLKANKAAQEADTAAKQAAIEKSFGLTKESGALVSKFGELVKAGDTASEAIKKIGKDFDLSTVPGIQQAGSVLDKLVADGKISATQFNQAWSDALKGVDLGEFETKARTAFDGTVRGAIELQQALDAGVREAVKRTGLDFDVLAGGIGKASRSAINDTDAIIKGLDSLKAKGVDTGQALSASLSKGINSADSIKALEAVKSQIEQVRQALGDKVADGLLDQAKTKAIELKNALEEATPGIQSLGEAMKQLGVTSDTEFKAIADKSKAAFDTMKESGKASARELQEAFQKVATDAIAANNGIAPEWVKTEAAVRKVTIAVDENGKATVDNAAKSKSAIGSVTQAWTEQELAANRAAKAAVNAKYARPGETANNVNDRYGRPTESPSQGSLPGNGANDMSFQFGLRDKLVNGTLTPADAADLEHLIKVMKGNEAIDRSATASKSFEGMRDMAYWAKIRQDMEYELQKMKSGNGVNANDASNDNNQNDQATTAPSGRSVYVNINTPQGVQKVHTDDAGAQAIVRSLRSASRAAGR